MILLFMLPDTWMVYPWLMVSKILPLSSIQLYSTRNRTIRSAWRGYLSRGSDEMCRHAIDWHVQIKKLTSKAKKWLSWFVNDTDTVEFVYWLLVYWLMVVSSLYVTINKLSIINIDEINLLNKGPSDRRYLHQLCLLVQASSSEEHAIFEK